jgi:hypothetical protein
MQHQVLADLVDVINDDRVFDQFGLAVNFLGELTTDGDFLVKGVKVDLVFVDVALADQFGILFFSEWGFILGVCLRVLRLGLYLRCLLRLCEGWCNHQTQREQQGVAQSRRSHIFLSLLNDLTKGGAGMARRHGHYTHNRGKCLQVSN